MTNNGRLSAGQQQKRHGGECVILIGNTDFFCIEGGIDLIPRAIGSDLDLFGRPR